MAIQSQFPGMVPLQYAQSPTMGAQLQGLGKAFQGLAPRPGAASVVPQPMNISPDATNAGTNMPGSGILDAIRGMSPQAILDRLKTMSAPAQPMPQGMPGSVALDGAGMLAPPPLLGQQYAGEIQSAADRDPTSEENMRKRLQDFSDTIPKGAPRPRGPFKIKFDRSGNAVLDRG